MATSPKGLNLEHLGSPDAGDYCMALAFLSKKTAPPLRKAAEGVLGRHLLPVRQFQSLKK